MNSLEHLTLKLVLQSHACFDIKTFKHFITHNRSNYVSYHWHQTRHNTSEDNMFKCSWAEMRFQSWRGQRKSFCEYTPLPISFFPSTSMTLWFMDPSTPMWLLNFRSFRLTDPKDSIESVWCPVSAPAITSELYVHVCMVLILPVVIGVTVGKWSWERQNWITLHKHFNFLEML